MNADSNSWESNIELKEKHENIYYVARAINEEGSLYTEIPCQADAPGPGAESCFFPLAEDEKYSESDNKNIEPSLDIIKAYFGADSLKYYFRIKTAGPINDGKLLPANFKFYAIGIYDPGRPSDIDPLHKTYFILYSPYFFANDESPVDNDGEGYISRNFNVNCAALSKKGDTWLFAPSNVSCKKGENELFISVSRSYFEHFSADVFSVYFFTGALYNDNNSIISDYTPITSLRIRSDQPAKR